MQQYLETPYRHQNYVKNHLPGSSTADVSSGLPHRNLPMITCPVGKVGFFAWSCPGFPAAPFRPSVWNELRNKKWNIRISHGGIAIPRSSRVLLLTE